MTGVIEIGGGEFSFCAAHAGLHPGVGFEPLHGHTFTAVLRVAGEVDHAGMVTDFGPVKAALREVIRPLRRRTLIAAQAPTVLVDETAGRLAFGEDDRRYDLPLSDVALLPLVNTTTEALAAYLLDQLGPALRQPGVGWVELALSEAPDVTVTIPRKLR